MKTKCIPIFHTCNSKEYRDEVDDGVNEVLAALEKSLQSQGLDFTLEETCRTITG